MKKALTILGAGALLSALILIFPEITQAGTDFGASNLSGLNLRNDAPDVFIASIIRWVLGIISAVLVALIVYGGFIYATSAGNDDRVQQGKKIITGAIIGVVITFAALLLSQFIVNALQSNPEENPAATNSQERNASNDALRSGNGNGNNTNPGSGSGSSGGNDARLPGNQSDDGPSDNFVELGGICGIEGSRCIPGTDICPGQDQRCREGSCVKPSGTSGSNKFCLYTAGQQCDTRSTNNFNYTQFVTGDKLQISNNGCALPLQCVEQARQSGPLGIEKNGVCK